MEAEYRVWSSYRYDLEVLQGAGYVNIPENRPYITIRQIIDMLKPCHLKFRMQDIVRAKRINNSIRRVTTFSCSKYKKKQKGCNRNQMYRLQAVLKELYYMKNKNRPLKHNIRSDVIRSRRCQRRIYLPGLTANALKNVINVLYIIVASPQKPKSLKFVASTVNRKKKHVGAGQMDSIRNAG